jgi:hypothetical protein
VRVTDPSGGPSSTSRGAAGLLSPPRQAGRWLRRALPLTLAGLALAGVGGCLVEEPVRGADPHASTPSSAGARVPSSELAGEWSGDGSLTDCAGLEDDDCTGTRSVTLTIDCSGKRCAVTPFDGRYGSPPLRFEDGRYRAVGPVPPDVAPTCDGAPTASALWRLELIVRDGRLEGRHAESTVQGFDCGATRLVWDLILERS